MARAVRHPTYTYEDYLTLEETSNTKHEFYEGQIYAMAGDSLDHGALAAVLVSLLRAQTAGRGCRVFNSDVRVRVFATGLVTYADLSLVCGGVERDPQSRVTVVNPVVLVELLSDGTAAYDRGEKFEHYRQIPSLRAYVLVDARTPAVEVRQRSGEQDTWQTEQAGLGESVGLSAVDVTLAVDDVYRDGLLGP